jgi:hypothetical protein
MKQYPGVLGCSVAKPYSMAAAKVARHDSSKSLQISMKQYPGVLGCSVAKPYSMAAAKVARHESKHKCILVSPQFFRVLWVLCIVPMGTIGYYRVAGYYGYCMHSTHGYYRYCGTLRYYGTTVLQTGTM